MNEITLRMKSKLMNIRLGGIERMKDCGSCDEFIKIKKIINVVGSSYITNANVLNSLLNSKESK